MINFLTSRLAGPIASGIAVILAITLAVVFFSKNAEITTLENSVGTLTTARDNLKADLIQCRTTTATLSLAIDDQNASITALRDASLAMEDYFGSRLAKLGNATDAALRRASDLASRPFASEDQCARFLEVDTILMNDLAHDAD